MENTAPFGAPRVSSRAQLEPENTSITRPVKPDQFPDEDLGENTGQ